MRDGVLLGILNHYFRAAAEASGYTLERTAYTTFIKESQDFTTALLTPRGEQFAYPVAIGAQSYIGIDYAPFIDALAPWQEGDIGIANCPYATGGVSTHLPDYHLLRPIFVDGTLIAFSWAFIHSSDMGGIVAGSILPSAYELYQEGLRITPKKLYRSGMLVPEVRDFLLSNVRIPDKNWGDLNAVVSALGIGEVRVQAAAAKWGLAELLRGRDALIDYAEERARAVIRTMPDRRIEFHDFLEDDFVSPVPVRVKLVVSKDGEDGLHFDFTGSDPQVAAAFNLATGGRHPFLCVGMFAYFRTIDPGIPINGGLIRPIRFTAPEGSVVNATFPAATGVRYAMTQLIFTIVQGVLAQAVPELVPAAGAGQATIPAISVLDPASGRRVVNVVQPMIGGSGARPWADGVEGCDFSLGSLRNTPTESLENEVPIRVRAYALIPDSGGAGRFRGGSAVRLDFQVFHPDTVITARGMERSRFQPWGLFGGEAGAPSDCWLNPDTSVERRLGKINVERLAAGDVVSIRTPAGGGHGDPWQRDPAAVAADVLDGLVSRAAAACAYGVTLDAHGVNMAGTAALRASAARPPPAVFDLGEGRRTYIERFTPALLDRLAERLAELLPSLRYRAKQTAHAEIEAALNAGQAGGPALVDSTWPRVLRALGVAGVGS